MLTCTVVVLTCFVVGVRMCGFCDVLVFGNICTCIYCVLYCLYCVFCTVSFMHIYSFFVCTSIRTNATQ